MPPKKRKPMKINRPEKKIPVDSVFYYYLIKELYFSATYCTSFFRYHGSGVEFDLQPTKVDLIDYKWNYRVTEMVRERCELDHALSWLSTLGGAFSALGDYFESWAERAGRISLNQLRLALRMGDESIVARCRLYFALSLIQKQKFGLARAIIYREYCNSGGDERLRRMCKGIWAKLQYEHRLHHRL